ncbi:hypothetical protein FOL47_000197 [Perkinsus chesapeaki]|uniref:Uncharacterized protein n=1 Tax=Perkinsus chesapeaki TaxID=330153 RepID=A0A7J6MM90_PERCH|nr:hypothetical protein FOL47_000197 [Perkinsus chesapeaki]
MVTNPASDTVPTEHNGDVEKSEQGMCTCARCIALALQHANGQVMTAQQQLEIALRAGPRREGDKGAGEHRMTSSDDLTDALELRRRQLQLERARELQQHIQNQMGLFQFWIQQLYTAHRSQEGNSEGEENAPKSAPFMITPYTHQWLISGTHRASEEGITADSDDDEHEDEDPATLYRWFP